MKIGRNDPCHCGSGKKYKHCHYAEDSVKHEMPEPEETVSEEVNDDSEEGKETEAAKVQPSHQKDRSRFEGQSRGKGSSFRPNATRGSQRGS